MTCVCHGLLPCDRTPFLVLNIAAYRCLRHTTYRTNEIASTPQRRQLRAQMPKLLPQETRRVALQLRSNFGRSYIRSTLHKQMHMIGHDFHGVQRQSQLLGFHHQEFLQSDFHRTAQDRFTVFWAKHKVILQREDSPSIVRIALMFHTLSISNVLDNINLSNKDCLPLGRGMRNWPSSNLSFPCQLKQTAPRKASLWQAQAGVRQHEVVIGVEDRQLLAYAGFVFAQRVDPPPNGRDMLAKVQVE